ncbi:MULTISPECIES: hypothetical protein [unclassified Agromyces]|uniref:hypothetical protein n=1 Tax=unclassified Agromyces TaxID=2639701 RepID=UPI00301465C8
MGRYQFLEILQLIVGSGIELSPEIRVGELGTHAIQPFLPCGVRDAISSPEIALILAQPEVRTYRNSSAPSSFFSRVELGFSDSIPDRPIPFEIEILQIPVELGSLETKLMPDVEHGHQGDCAEES